MEKKKPFYGWVIVAASVALMMLGCGAFTGAAAAYIAPVCAQMGFAKGEFTLYRTIVSLLGALLMPVFARLIRKAGVKKVMLIGLMGNALAYTLYSFAGALWQFYLAAALEGIFTNGISFLSIGVLINNWFLDNRSTVAGIAYAGTGLGGAVFVPIISQLAERLGWRWAYRGVAAVSVAVLLPVILLLLRDRPAQMGLAPYQAPGKKQEEGQAPAGAGSGVSLFAAKKMPAFWLLIFGFFLLNICCGGPSNHNVAFLQDLGYSTAFAAAVTSGYMAVVAAGKIAAGTLFDRLGTPRTALLLCAACIGFPVLALFCRVPGIPWAYAAFLGFTGMGPSVGISALVRHVFGDRDFASIFSLASMASTLGAAVAAPLMGVIYDASGSYTPAWMLWLVFSVLMAACLMGALLAAKKREKAAEKAKA
ncbi:MFS transporter [Christensenellaceae bacterium 44-20]